MRRVSRLILGLNGIEVIKIVDYNGKMGLLTRNNGFIVGPYPTNALY